MLNILNVVYTLRFFSLQNAVCFIILTYLVRVLFTFYIQGVLKLKEISFGVKGLRESQTEWIVWATDTEAGAGCVEWRWHPGTLLAAAVTPLFVSIFYSRLLTYCFDVGMKRRKESHEFLLETLTIVIECWYFFVEINNRTRHKNTIWSPCA